MCLFMNYLKVQCKTIFVSDEDKELAKLLTGYQDMIGLLKIHKAARLNTQVIFIHFYFIFI